MTRRSVLAAGAGLLAGGLLRPHRVLAQTLAAPPPTRLSELALGRLAAGATSTVLLAATADLVGVSWRGAPHAGVQIRFRGAGGRWTPWASAEAHGHGPDGSSVAAGGRVVGEPLWTGGTRELQLRAAGALEGVRLHLVDVSAGLGASRALASRNQLATATAVAAALPLAAPQLPAGAGQPPIIARRLWAQGISPPRVAPGYGAVRMAFVHHTENPNGYRAGEVPAMLRAIYAFHRYVNGWNDIGYNFVIDLYGRIFEARAGGVDEPVVGAHAGGYNLASTGVAVLGSFMNVPISAPARAALERLLAWKLPLHGVPAIGSVTVKVNPAGASYSRFPAGARVLLPRIAGHRDGDSTDCPGDVLYAALPGLRTRVLALAPRPSRLTLLLAPSPPSPAPAPSATPQAYTLTGALAFLDGTPIAGATVLVQARTVGKRGEVVLERTLAEAVTDAQGRWSVPGSYGIVRKRGLWLRAVYAGVPGASGTTISEPLGVAVQPLSPPAAPAPTPPAAVPPGP